VGAEIVIATLRQRIHDALFLRSRLGELDALFRAAKDRQYEFLSIADFHAAIAAGRALPERTLILRHDVDWDLRTARAMFDLERRHAIRASWCFRLATVDRTLMRELAAAGHDVGYHFEELAELGKCHGAATADELRALVPRAREMFCENLARLRRETGLPMPIVASHGDFLNRRLGVTNSVLIDASLRARMNILAETYDELLQRPVTSRIADCGGPKYWKPREPRAAVENGDAVIYILLHPNAWDSNALGAVWHLWTRLTAELFYQIRLRTNRNGRRAQAIGR
jgi:peptidoglycan/xylan/chitin deacetylase (PgdA/CDA1 family)